MTYAAPLHLAVVLASKRVAVREVAFWCEAVALQLREHVAPAWGLPAPGVQLYPVDSYIPTTEGMLIAIVDDDGNDEAAGYHNPLGGVVDLGQSAVPSRTLSHEALEMYGNWALDRWSSPDYKGREHAMELCDACQRQSYFVPVELFGERRSVEVSDFVYPCWFDQQALTANVYTHCRSVMAPFALAPGGYSIAKDGDEIVYLTHVDGALTGKAKVSPRSRTSRIVGRW